MNTKDWNPNLYLKFGKERIQPSIDLVMRIEMDEPSTIIDIGCGPGNSTQILAHRWPDAEIVGIDNSPAMIEKAKSDYSNQNWYVVDADKDEIEGKYDIVFSNAVIQWIPDHPKLFKKFYNLLTNNGLIAIQVPIFWDMPLGKAIANVASQNQWASKTKGATKQFTIHDYHFYYDILSEIFKSVDIWESHYMHVVDSHLSILEMIRSTGLRPFHNLLEKDTDKQAFEDMVLRHIEKDYPLQKNGKVLLPFKRLFFIAKK
ncbi:MAG: methyltransferase domain-containing protein [Bacteroidales bacterium]|nr:methyltransferase domain-containing protein [Bacteroidales bacterium]